jgi:hypothetical protein
MVPLPTTFEGYTVMLRQLPSRVGSFVLLVGSRVVACVAAIGLLAPTFAQNLAFETIQYGPTK